MSTWAETAGRVIARVHFMLPENATLKERKNAVDDAYPFGERSYWPYRAWCKARRVYLIPYGYKPPSGVSKTNAQLKFDLLPRDPKTGRPVI